VGLPFAGRPFLSSKIALSTDPAMLSAERRKVNNDMVEFMKA
jgi:hypothetical protein